MRLKQLALPALMSFCVNSGAAYSAETNLVISERLAAPMVELSALASDQGQLLFASDREHDLLKVSAEESGVSQSSLNLPQRVNLDLNLSSSEQAQWEALFSTPQDGLFLVKETGSEIYHFAANGQKLQTYTLASWSGRQNPKRGFEGILPLRRGHVLIALEAEPPALIEYGPEGDTVVGFTKGDTKLSEAFVAPSTTQLVPLAAWTIKSSLGDCEYSDLAEDPKGGFYILMKGCMKLVKVEQLKPENSTFKAAEVHSIPSEIYHPEGLNVREDGDFWIGIDIKEKGTNLYRLTR